jgi:hypothetical protein
MRTASGPSHLPRVPSGRRLTMPSTTDQDSSGWELPAAAARDALGLGRGGPARKNQAPDYRREAMRARLRRAAGRARQIPVWVRWLIAATVMVAFALWLVLVAPTHFVPAASEADLRSIDAARRLELQNDVRTTLLQGLGGLAVLIGAFFAYRQLVIAREGQVTERFTRAIDQLGHDNLDVRLGGIYALERIAKDSPQDRAAINEVLNAFVRGHAPWPPTRPGQYTRDAPIEDVPELRVRAADVQAVLTLLCGAKMPVDLRATDLRYAHLQNAQLQGANLYGAQLQRADLTGAKLQGALLYLAELQQAHLLAANLHEAILSGAQLQEAHLFGAHLEGAHLESAQLQRADLRNARLQGAHLKGAQLQGAWGSVETVWPDGFDWKAAGVELHEVEELYGYR